MEDRAKNPDSISAAATRIEAANFEPLSSDKRAWSVTLNPRTCLIIVLLALGAFCAWFMLTAKAVYIETEPSNADVDISGHTETETGEPLPGASWRARPQPVC